MTGSRASDPDPEVPAKVERRRYGLSNVLYWGYARQPFRDFRVSDFRKTMPDPEREPKPDQFAQLMRSGLVNLSNIKELQLRHQWYVSARSCFGLPQPL